VGDVIGFIYSNGKWKQTATICVEMAYYGRRGTSQRDGHTISLKMIDNLFNSFTCHAVPGLL
jgi:hypothetical protein